MQLPVKTDLRVTSAWLLHFLHSCLHRLHGNRSPCLAVLRSHQFASAFQLLCVPVDRAQAYSQGLGESLGVNDDLASLLLLRTHG